MARLPQDFIDRVLEATDAVAEFRQYIPTLKKAGREWSGLCPVHKEKSPSFYVNGDKGLFVCRGCGINGTVLTFVAEQTGRSFRDVVLDYAKRAGLQPPAEDNSPQRAAADRAAARSSQLLERAAELYSRELLKNDEAMRYLADRGITEEHIQRFRIGFAPRGGKFLQKSMPDATPHELEEAGLARLKEEQKEFLDWMNNRIVFPIRARDGKTIAFGGRTMGTNGPKYLNTPETRLFKKGAVLYGMHEASAEIRKCGRVIVTEGYIDVVIPSVAGFANSVASMGTALQGPTLKRLMDSVNEIVFCFDGDNAGRRAAVKALELVAPELTDRSTVRFAFLPEGMDPDEVILREGPDAYRAHLDAGLPLSRYMVKHFSSDKDMTSVEGKARFASEAIAFIRQVNAPIMKALLVAEVQSVVGPHIPIPGLTDVNPAPAPVPAPAPPQRSAFGFFGQRGASASARPPQPPAAPPAPAKPAQPRPEAKGAAPAAPPSRQRPAFGVRTAGPAASEQPAPRAPEARLVERPASAPSATQERPPPHQVATPAPAAPQARRPAFAVRRDNPIASPALRMIALALREPRLCEQIAEPELLDNIRGSVIERDTLIAVVDQAITLGLEEPSTKEHLLRELRTGEHTSTIDAALRQAEFQEANLDVASTVATLAEHCRQTAETANACRP